MAKRGTSKRFSIEQEEEVARQYNGKRSKTSGAAAHDSGDVRTKTKLIEAKTTGSVIKPKRSISLKVDDFEKITKEAYAEGRIPAMALRICEPKSFLADVNGHIDLIVYRLSDDSVREHD